MRKAVGFEIPVIFDASETFDPDVLSFSSESQDSNIQKGNSKSGNIQTRSYSSLSFPVS